MKKLYFPISTIKEGEQPISQIVTGKGHDTPEGALKEGESLEDVKSESGEYVQSFAGIIGEHWVK